MYIIKLFKKKFRSIAQAKKIKGNILLMACDVQEKKPLKLLTSFWLLVTYSLSGLLIETISFGALLSINLFSGFGLIFLLLLSYSKNVMEAVIIRESVNFDIMQFCRSIHRKYQFPTSIYLDTCILYNFMVLLKMKLAFNFRRPFFVFLVNSGLQIIFCCSSQWLFSAMLIHNHFICPKKEIYIYKEIGQSNPLTHI